MSEITKKALAGSFKALMETNPIAKITVNDIVKTCGVSRRTFYYNFQDVYALLEWIFKNEISQEMAGKKTYETWQEGFLSIFYYLKSNQKMVTNVYKSIGREKLEVHLYNEVYILVTNVINEVTKEKEVSPDDKEFVINFFKVALVGLLLEWIRGNMLEDPKKIVSNLDRLITGDTRKALYK